MAGLLVRRPARLVDVELVDEKYLCIRLRAIGQEQLNAGLRHRRPDQLLKPRREPLLFPGICFELYRHHESLVEFVASKSWLRHVENSPNPVLAREYHRRHNHRFALHQTVIERDCGACINRNVCSWRHQPTN